MPKFATSLYVTVSYRTDVILEAVDLDHAVEIGHEVASTIDLDEFDCLDTEYEALVHDVGPMDDDDPDHTLLKQYGDVSVFCLDLAATSLAPTETVAYVTKIERMTADTVEAYLPGLDQVQTFTAPAGRSFTVHGPVQIHLLQNSEGPIPGSSI